MFILLKI